MKNVVLFANSTWCIYNFRFNLIRKLLEQGCRVHILAPLDPTYDNETFLKEFEKLNLIFHEIPLEPRGKNPFRELRSIFILFETLRDIRPDVVLTYTVKCNLYAGLCRQILGFKQVANVPGLGEVFEKMTFLRTIVSALYRFAFRGISVAFFQNREDLKFCLDGKLVPKEKCIIIPGSGVDLSRFQPTCPPRHTGKRVFLMFGRLLPQKGYLEYLQAAEELKQQIGDKAECWVMGIEDKNRPDSIALYEKLQEAAARGVIRMVPTQVDVVPILSDVDVVVLPSRYNEGIPRSLLEALACGKAIITTDWRGCRETVENGKNGYLIPVNNVSDLTETMLRIANMDDLKIRSLGRQSRALVEERFDERIVLREYLRVAIGYHLPSEKPATRIVHNGNLQNVNLGPGLAAGPSNVAASSGGWVRPRGFGAKLSSTEELPQEEENNVVLAKEVNPFEGPGFQTTDEPH